MGLFSRKKKPGVQPHRGWPWTLSVGGVPAPDVAWEDIARAMEGLIPDTDSFVILEQKSGKDYWYIQSAIALKGPHAGQYTVGCGWPGPEGPKLVEWHGGFAEALAKFETVWRGRPLDFSGFEDQSAWLNS